VAIRIRIRIATLVRRALEEVCSVPVLLVITRPHRKTTLLLYVHMAYCHRPGSVVCLSVGLSVTVVSPAKTTQPIKMPFWLRSRMGFKEPCITRGPDPSWKWVILRGKSTADTISLCNQAPKPTQPTTLSGMLNEYRLKGAMMLSGCGV